MDGRITAILDVLAPARDDLGGERCPIFEWGHETTPTDAEMVDLARNILAKIDEAKRLAAE